MSVIHDYTVSQLHAQRSRELQAEAAQDRLAQLARAGRAVWWQRLLSARVQPVSRRGHSRPVTHRVA